MNTEITVTKLDAARRQLQTAIELWVRDGDPVSIHTLAYSAYQIIHDLNRQRKGPPLLLDSDLVRPEKRKEWVNIIKSDANFFKHADDWGKKKKSPPSIEFQPSVNEDLFAFAIIGLNYMGEELGPFEIAFQAWYSLHRPDVLNDSGRQLLKNAVHADELDGIRKIPKGEFMERFLKIIAAVKG